MPVRTSTILEIISASAVVISLVFVGFEIRNSSEQVEQNTQALQIAAYQDLIGRIVEINSISIAESMNVESLIAIDSPTEEDLRKLSNFLWILFRHGDMAYFQYEKGAISEERLESAMGPILARLRYPQVAARWKTMRVSFVPAYRKYIDLQIEKIDAGKPNT
jgi:hypothetical protein